MEANKINRDRLINKYKLLKSHGVETVDEQKFISYLSEYDWSDIESELDNELKTAGLTFEESSTVVTDSKTILDKPSGLKKVSTKEKSNSDVYEIYLGTFIDNAFTWYSVKEIKSLTEAYKEFKSYVNTQLKYTDEELQQIWDTGRLDIELRKGSKLLNWVGIYSREVKPLDKKEEKQVEKGDIKNKSAKKK